MFNLKINTDWFCRYYSLKFKAKVDGDVISIAENNEEENQEHFKKWEGGYQKQKEIFKAHKDYISYELIFNAKVKTNEYKLEEDEKNNPNYKYESNGFAWSVDVGKRKSITIEELKKLVEEDIASRGGDTIKRLHRIDWDTAKFSFVSLYDVAFSEYDEYVSMADLTRIAMDIVKDKSTLEDVIKNFENKELSTKEYMEIFSKAYSWKNEEVIDKIVKNRFKEPQCFEIKTNLNGPSISLSEGHGRDFSYEFIPTKKDLKVYAEAGTQIDTKKVYKKAEIKELMEDKRLIVVDNNGLWFTDSKIPDFTSNITQEEVDKTIRESITKEMLMKDYKKFMNFYKLNKIEIGLKVKDIKEDKNSRVNGLMDEKGRESKAVKIMEENDCEL